jgi:hypothetical protein
MEFFVPITLFIAITYIIKVAIDNKTRRLLIEKGAIDESVKYYFKAERESAVPGSLKWGMMLAAIGLAVFLGQYYGDGRDEFTIGLMFLFAGLALIGYYFLAKRMTAKSEKTAL